MTTVVQETDAKGTRSAPSISSRAKSTQDSPIRKLSATAEARKQQGVKVYHLNIGQPDLPTHPIVFDTIRELKLQTLAYAPSNGLPQAVQAWKSYYQACGIDVQENEIIVTAGGSEAIVFAMCAICDYGDDVIVFEPFYTNYNGFASIANIKLNPIPLRIQDGFHLPPSEEIERRITSRTRAILICNPSNPTGTIYTREEMLRLVDIVKRHNLFLLSDEVYREFAYDTAVNSVFDFPEIADQAVLLDSTSKRFNVCGARIGALASHNKEIVQSAFRFGMARLSVASIEQLALVPLLQAPKTYTQPIVEEFRRRRDVVYAGLATIPGVTFYKPEGAFYIMVGLPVKDAEHFSKWLIAEYEYERETVLLAPGPGFYASRNSGSNEVRLAFMLKGEDLRRALTIVSAALAEYSKKF
ncbi:MAG: pyridoxal phosphate-dependent aminotransferase [Ignavibacteriales bacterium]|nr:pyridoxal phosphate-dependent aminotransferase [Ignavibacteriales bacterium]